MPPEVPFDYDASVFPDSWVLQWVDQFASLPQFTPVPVEAGLVGSRIYQDELSLCAILLFAGPASTGTSSVLDDRSLSDAQLDGVLEIGLVAVAEFAIDHVIPQPAQNGSIAVRLILGEPGDGTSTATAARVIGSQGQAAFIFISCPEGGATGEFDMLMGTGILALTAAPPPA